ncbi:ATP-binding protein [Nocardioides daejeonensis]|uniref:ATP-binding protein n=1 Tax=Nocardioides daejeonensis TaxID=1046556 RepID=UPI000D74F949|nr:ATP-binding protein [Nocardioides daejeonensis]
MMRSLSATVLRRLVEDPRRGASGWASRALDRAIDRVAIRVLLGSQFLMIAAGAMAGAETLRTVLVLIAHGVLAVVAAGVLREKLPLVVLVAISYPCFVIDWWAAPTLESPLLFAACWMVILVNASSGVLVRGRRAFLVPVVGSLLTPVAMLVTRPERQFAEVPMSFAVTGLSVAVVVRLGYGVLWGYVRQADAAAEAAEREERLLAATRAASREAAEDARTLHDTVINTLGAIASGGAALSNPAEVRARCARDIEAVGILSQGGQPPVAWENLLQQPGITVVRTGLSQVELDSYLAAQGPEASRALGGIVAELVQNAAKHSGADRVTVDVGRTDARLVVTVRDQGRGFDGQVPPGRGLALSVLGRASAAGLAVDIRTAPGKGTAVRILHAPAGPEEGDGGVMPLPGIEPVMAGVRRGAAWLWATGLILVGIVLAISNHHGRPTHEFTMVGIDAFSCVLAWVATRRGRRLGKAGTAVLAVAGAAAFLATAVAVGYGLEAPVRWQALGATGPLVLLVALAGRRGLAAGGMAVAATSVGTALFVAGQSWQAAAIVMMAGAISVGFPVGWYGFQVALARIGAAAAADQRRNHLAQVDAAVTRSAAESRARWRAAGLHRSLSILREIAAGSRQPDDPAVRRACGNEEFHLRQLVRLDPDLVRMGRWLVRALSLARERDVQLVVRTGSSDLNLAQADRAGRMLLAAVAAAPTGQSVTMTLFDDPAGMRLTLVAPHPHLLGLTDLQSAPQGVHTLGDQDFVELMFEREQVGARAA